MSAPLTYADFIPGSELGVQAFVIDETTIARWLELYPDDKSHDRCMPIGLVSVVLIRAVIGVVQPRPPGNIHGDQRIEVQALPEVGQTVETAVRCLTKEVRRERRWVRFGATARDTAGRLLFGGCSSIIWAR